MMNKIILALTILNALHLAISEPPISSYGTPQSPPINSYGTPNYHANDHDDHYHQEPKAYEFGYQVKDDYTGSNYNQQETSDGNQVRGQYRVALPDGRIQIVTYWADWKSGYHADVKYEGEAQYPETYNTGKDYNQNGYQQNDNGGYANNAGYNNNQHNGYDGYNNNGYSHQPSNVYGAI